MKLGLVAQRYGMDIAGGAELHCRLVAEHLAKNHSVEVFTTCARDYVTWRNEFSPGATRVNGITVHRYPVRRGRNIRAFENIQNLVFHEPGDAQLEERWIRENGPYCPKLVDAVGSRQDIDIWILFSYRYWTTVQALRLHTRKALLVPTAEHDPALYLGVVRELFQLPGAIVYNSIEERDLIRKITGNHSVPGDVVGVGLVENQTNETESSDSVPDLSAMDPYVLYVGRIDKNKGCDHLFRMFQRFDDEAHRDVRLVLIGKSVIPIPDHPRILHLGFLSEKTKEYAYRNCRLLVMPSQYESLSMVLLEAWKYSRPALVNGRCEVLAGQSGRSNGGLAYTGYDEFAAGLDFLLRNRNIADRMGILGHHYYLANYSWPVIESKYEQLLSRVVQGGIQRS